MERLNDIKSIDEASIAAAVGRSEQIIIQYSKPGYSRQLLTLLDSLCRQHGDRIEIRFYGHDGEAFDCRTLNALPHVQRLAVNCLESVLHLEALFELPMLRHLSFGTNSDTAPDFLAHQNLTELRSLTLGESKKSPIDLSPLAGFSKLEWLNLVGHHRGIDALGKLSRLHWLTLSRIGKTVPFGFVSQLPVLQTLRVILGGRENFHEVTHPSLMHLQIIRVRGFESFRPDDFPALQSLQIEDQIRLHSLRFSRQSDALRKLRLLNCKRLASLHGLETLSALEEVRIYDTAIPFEELIHLGLPPALKVFAFYTAKTSLDGPIRQKLDALGYAERGE